MNKNELKEGDVYINQYTGFLFKCAADNKLIYSYRLSNTDRKDGYTISFEKNSTHNHYDSLRLATPEEKHWLESCIKLDKFVSLEEAMKSFPKEVIKVKPFDILSFKGGLGTIKGLYNKEHDLYRFESTNSSYTLENLLINSEFVVINSVINEEGNIFMINDTITTLEGVNKGKSFIIIGFRLNKAKTMICAITNVHFNGVGINKIEHFIEKEIVIEETLLEKAKRLYPIGTKFNNHNIIPSVITSYISKGEFYEKEDGEIFVKSLNNGSFTIYINGKWAEIIEDVKVGDKFRFKYYNSNKFVVDKIEDSNDGKIIFYKTDNNYELPHNRVLLKNITIIK